MIALQVATAFLMRAWRVVVCAGTSNMLSPFPDVRAAAQWFGEDLFCRPPVARQPLSAQVRWLKYFPAHFTAAINPFLFRQTRTNWTVLGCSIRHLHYQNSLFPKVTR